MLDGLTERLGKNIQAFKHVMDVHDHARTLYDATPTTPDPWAATRAASFTKTDWHIYDHCAAFTRLYAIYATYVEDLIETYLDILPTLYPTYNGLPKAITTQHRVGLSNILGKLSDGGAYNYLDEKTIVTTLSDGLTGNAPYKLLKHAFLTDRQNYRMEILGRVLGYLGIENGTQRLCNNRNLLAFLDAIKPGATTVQNELDQFVTRRNEAAHSDINDIVASEEVKQTADFIHHLGIALTDILTYALTNRRHALGYFPQLGTVEKIYQYGNVLISHVVPCMLRIGEQLAIVRNNNLELATITGLQLDGVAHEQVILTDAAELGIEIDKPTREGAVIYALRDQQTKPHQFLRIVEQRGDEIIGLLTDDFTDLGFITENGAYVDIESVDNVEFDNPRITNIEETTATLAVTAHVTFTATATYDDPGTGIYDSEDKAVYFMEARSETVQRTVRIPFEVFVEFEDDTSLTHVEGVSVSVQNVNDGNDVVFDLERPEDLR